MMNEVAGNDRGRLPGDLDDVIDAALESAASFIGRPSELKKLAMLQGIEMDDLKDRIRDIQRLIKKVPVQLKHSTKDDPAYVQRGQIPGLKTKSRSIKWDRFGAEGIFLNNKHDWSSNESYKSPLTPNRVKTISHEVDHVVSGAIHKVMGVDRDDAQRDKIEKVSPRAGGHQWVDRVAELADEIREFRKHLIDDLGHDQEETFTEEAVKMLAFFTLIDHVSGGKGRLQSASDDKLEKWIAAAREEWPASLGDPDGKYVYTDNKVPMWQYWLDKKDGHIPIHHNMLPGIYDALNPQSLEDEMASILDNTSGWNTIAAVDTDESDPDDDDVA